MTLADIISLICTKINQNEQEDQAACRTFLQRRHELIWLDQLWKDSLIEYQTTITSQGYTFASTYLPTSQRLILPTIFTHVMAVRTNDRALNVQSQDLYYRIDYDTFNQGGSLVDFVLLPPCVWETDTPTTWYARSDYRSGADNSAVITVDTLDSDGVGVTRNSFALGASPVTQDATSRWDIMTKLATAGSISLYDQNDDVFVTVAAKDTAAKKHQRIVLVGKVADGTPVKVLGKRATPQFTDDNDTPGVTSSENLLISLGMADMLQRSRQYGKAAEHVKEATGLMQQLVSVETVKQAHNKRILPQLGYAWEYQVGVQPPLTF
jgi:hypothetical protein